MTAAIMVDAYAHFTTSLSSCVLTTWFLFWAFAAGSEEKKSCCCTAFPPTSIVLGLDDTRYDGHPSDLAYTRRCLANNGMGQSISKEARRERAHSDAITAKFSPTQNGIKMQDRRTRR
ncbi:hypothetical protein B0H16DRAFT_1729064 [Mycena metata]|uniref:Uncharacterized protein n=1 Tax=Mycena metata TaxID=1033252 RepID=A0AAD7N0K3_9AGAR|nr:hypothetical protein B0H16DRAFT_1729064 [Mycena metata]